MVLPPAFLALLRRHPAFLLTVAYLSVSTIGLMFSWAFFRRFDVNYFLFADLTDFLLAAAREPMAVLAGIGGFLVIVLAYRYGAWEVARLERRQSRGRLLDTYVRLNRWALHSGWLTLAMIVVYAYAFVSFYAAYRADQFMDGQGVVAEVRLGDDEPVSLRLMGSSARFIFLYDPETHRTLVVPDESLRSIAILAPAEVKEDAPAGVMETPDDDA